LPPTHNPPPRLWRFPLPGGESFDRFHASPVLRRSVSTQEASSGPFWTAAACYRFLRLDVKLRQLADALLQWPDRQFPKTNAASCHRRNQAPVEGGSLLPHSQEPSVLSNDTYSSLGLLSYEEGTESCFQENKMTRWYDDDTFWENLDWFFFSQFRTPETTSIEADQIVKLLQPAPSSSILDLCCGPGRHCLEFARRGFGVTGVDRTARYLELARTRSVEQRLDIEFLQTDMKTFRRAESFDFALNLFSSFGYFEDPNDHLQVLRNLQESLKPGGTLRSFPRPNNRSDGSEYWPVTPRKVVTGMILTEKGHAAFDDLVVEEIR
jgi:2-polyprenyl-3-methyl-5-hydroxy-6-metoxy-1,4-benzoquinol methylase